MKYRYIFTAVKPCAFYVEPSSKFSDCDRVGNHLFLSYPYRQCCRSVIFVGNFEHILYLFLVLLLLPFNRQLYARWITLCSRWSRITISLISPTWINVKMIFTKDYSEPFQTYKMRRFAKIIKRVLVIWITCGIWNALK